MTVTLSSVAVQLGLGGIFREALIDEDFVVGTWPLSEVSSLTARDITGNDNHGTYSGSGFTRGVTVPLPEGALGCTFNGSSYVLVPDDGSSGQLTLSLANGDMDIVFLIKTTTIDATVRAVLQKQVSDWQSNGWHAALYQGGINFYLRVAGSLVFNFTNGSIADGSWHLVHCCYQTAAGEARIFIDGVQSGATVTGVTTEPAYVAADLRIGMFNDGSGAFVGTLSYAMCGREGNSSLSTTLQATRAWTDIIGDVRADTPIEAEYGIPGSGVADLVAGIGTMTFALDNSANNSGGAVGYYSPGHSSCRTNFAIGAPVRLALTYSGTTYYKFRGSIKAVTPLAGINRERTAMVLCTDWLDVAAINLLSSLPTQINQSSDTVFGRVLDQSDRPPAAVSIGAGTELFPYAIDNSQGESTALMSEFARIADSERGYVYLKGDTVQGGTLVWEGRQTRETTTGVAATFSDTMRDLDVTYDLSDVVNIARVTVYPRRTDTLPNTVLYALPVAESEQAVAPNTVVVIEGAYRDPDQKAVRVGGFELVTPAATTDYSANTSPDGGGADMTAFFTVTAGTTDLGGNLVRFTVINTDTSRTGYITKLQVRGRGIYHENPATVEARDRDSVRKYGPRPVSIDMPYQSSTYTGQAIGDFVLAQFANPVQLPRSMGLDANKSDTLMTQALTREPGDRIGIVETVTGATTTVSGTSAIRGHFIQQVKLAIPFAKVLMVDWTLAPSAPGTFWVWDQVGNSEWDLTTTWGA